MTLLGSDYIDSFLSSHFPYDYALEPIIYPRVGLRRKYTNYEIAHMRQVLEVTDKKTEQKRTIRIRPQPCKPTLLEHHLRRSKNKPFCEPKRHIDYKNKEEWFTYEGPRWLLVTYYDDSLVNFLQVDIDRHGEDDTRAKEQVQMLQQAEDEYGFDIVWTTSPGSLEKNDLIRHGLYAWIRLDSNHFVMDIRDCVLAFLRHIGLSDIANDHEGAYLKQKKADSPSRPIEC